MGHCNAIRGTQGTVGKLEGLLGGNGGTLKRGVTCIGKRPFHEVTKLKQLLSLTAHSRMKQSTKMAMKGKRRRVFSLTSKLLIRFCP